VILTTIDWLVILAYFVFSLIIALAFSRRAGRSLEEYFLSDRRVPWWLAGTSMVATTFAADTPLAVTGLTVRHGIAGNWLWWSFVMSGILTAFFYARLWRRAGVMTDVEFAELRYSGRPAAFLRGFRALYLAVPINCIIIGWVTHAMATILGMTLGVAKWEATIACFVITAIYSSFSGLWGVLVTDFFQFALAMTGSIVLAVVAVQAVGGLPTLVSRLQTQFPDGSPLSFFPGLDSPWMPILTFLVYVSVNWWASWYPGAEPGGGGYVAQRIFSAKDERHSVLAALWFNLAHYALRPWPWILVALVSMLLYPGLPNPEEGYVKVMVEHLPPAWRGFLLAAFLAAYMSTISTHLNWGSSYLINDLYRRFMVRSGTPRHYVWAGRYATIGLMVVAGIITYYLKSVEGAWKFLLAIGAGTGPVLLLRWYWWRINAWSEVSAMAGAALISLGLQWYGLSSDDPLGFAYLMLLTVAGATLVWVLATYLTPPEPDGQLLRFYERVRPSVAGWGVLLRGHPEVKPSKSPKGMLVVWVLGCLVVYLGLFGIGKILLGAPELGWLLLAIAVLLTAWILWGFGAAADVPAGEDSRGSRS